MKILKTALVVLLILFVVAQFFGPQKNAGHIALVNPFLIETNPPENVQNLLRKTCFDCHSSNTRYPWYNNITPINYWLADHIDDGKKHLNFSEWSTYSNKKKDHKLDELIEMVEKKEMPLPSYTWTHKEAKLSDKEIQELVDWASKLRTKYQTN